MRTRGSSTGKPRSRKLAAVLLGLVAAFALVETALWTASLFVVPEDRFALLAPAPGERRILCFGDSNTYGVNLPAEASYPAQLGRFLDRAPGNPWRVVNLGYPGQNSAQVRGRLAANLELYRPEVVVIWIGINNTWSFALAHLWDVPDAEPAPGLLQSLVQHCRTYGMLRMLHHRWLGKIDPLRGSWPGRGELPGLDGSSRGEGAGEVGEVDPRPDLTRGPSDFCHGLGIDLRRMRAICDEHGAKLLYVTYPIDVPFVVEKVNPCIRGGAEDSGTPLADLEAQLLPIIRHLGRPLMQFEDYHATANGNYETARLILANLVAEGLLEARPEWTDVPHLESRLTGWSAVALGRVEGEAKLELSGPPWAPYRVILEARVEGGQGRASDSVALRLREESGLALEEQRAYFGQLDPAGSLVVGIPLPPRATGSEVAARSGGRFVDWRLRVLLGKYAGRGQRDGEVIVIDLDPEARPER